MRSGTSRSPAFSNSAATLSSPASPRRNARSAKLSSTGAAGILGLLQLPFLPFVLGPLLRKRLVAGLALENAAQAVDGVACHRLEQDALVDGGHDGTGAILDVVEPAEPQRDD